MAPNQTTNSFWTARTQIKGLLKVHTGSRRGDKIRCQLVYWAWSCGDESWAQGLRGPNTVMRLLARKYGLHNCDNKCQGEEEHLRATHKRRLGLDMI